MLQNGAEYVEFKVFRKESVRTSGGRVLHNAPVELGSFYGILAQARGEEKKQWNQLSHPVTHKVLVKDGLDLELVVGDVLQFYVGKQMREMLISAVPYPVAGLSFWTILYGEERRDLALCSGN